MTDQQPNDQEDTASARPVSALDDERRDTLLRGLYIVLFALIYSIAEVVIATVVVLQFGFVLITREKNDNLLAFGAQVSAFIYQVLRYVTFNSDERPFPFDDWPAAPSAENLPGPN